MGAVERWSPPPGVAVTPQLARAALFGPDRQQGYQVVMALSGLGEAWALELLLQGLAHPDGMTRCLAAEGLERWWRVFGQDPAPDALVAAIARLLRDSCEEVQVAAVSALLAVSKDEGARVLAERYPEVSEPLKAEILGALVTNGYNALAAMLYRTGVAEVPGTYLSRVARRLRLDGGGGSAAS